MKENSRNRRRRPRYLTGEDIDMFREKKNEDNTKNQESTCDKNIDGA
jgi:hypothetical protein